MSTVAHASPAPQAARSPARIGPNAVLQTLRALAELETEPVVLAIRKEANLPDPLPAGMIPEAWFVRLVDALRAILPRERAEEVLRRSGTYTADYVAANRIPGFFRAGLRVLPARVAVPALLSAFRRHAWTFAGAGRFDVEGGYPGTIVLVDAPTCRGPYGGPGTYYEAAFTGLLRLAAAGVSVRELACQGDGSPACRFRISIDDSPPPGASCASS